MHSIVHTKYRVRAGGELTHDLDSADGTSVTLNVPAPHCHGIPFLETEHLLVLIVVERVSGTAHLYIIRRIDRHSIRPLSSFSTEVQITIPIRAG